MKHYGDAVKTLIIPMLLCLILFTIPTSTLSSNTTSVEVTITITNEGTVLTEIRTYVDIGLFSLKAPVEPIIPTLKARINSNETAVVYTNNTFYIPVSEPGVLEITYLVNTTFKGNIFSFKVYDVGVDVVLIAKPNIILLSIPSVIEQVRAEDNSLVIVFKPPALIEYTMSITSMETPETSSETLAQTPISKSNWIAGFPREYIFIIALTIIALAAILVWSFMKKKKRLPLEELDETDKLILKTIKNYGGSIMQSQLQRSLGLPKATLWRRVNKLTKLGYLEIIKEGKSNKLILKKKHLP